MASVYKVYDVCERAARRLVSLGLKDPRIITIEPGEYEVAPGCCVVIRWPVRLYPSWWGTGQYEDQKTTAGVVFWHLLSWGAIPGPEAQIAWELTPRRSVGSPYWQTPWLIYQWVCRVGVDVATRFAALVRDERDVVTFAPMFRGETFKVYPLEQVLDKFQSLLWLEFVQEQEQQGVVAPVEVLFKRFRRACFFHALGYASRSEKNLLFSLDERYGTAKVSAALRMVEDVVGAPSLDLVEPTIYYLDGWLTKGEYEFILTLAPAGYLGWGRNPWHPLILRGYFEDRFGRLPSPEVFKVLLGFEDVHPQTLVEAFSVPAIRDAISIAEQDPSCSLRYAVTLALVFGRRVKQVVERFKRSGRSLHSLAASLDVRVCLERPEIVQWIVSHLDSSAELIQGVQRCWDVPGFPRDQGTSQIYAWLQKHQADLEWEECRLERPDIPWDDLRCDLPRIHVEVGDAVVRVLDPDDKLQVILGPLTHCCQHRAGAGASCMWEGLKNPSSGFLVFERGHKVIGQAWIWAQDDILVLDNIELADGRTPASILDVLRAWLQAHPYQDIQMGLGYNAVSVGVPLDYDDPKPWLSGYQGYTDAHERVWLKRAGCVLV